MEDKMKKWIDNASYEQLLAKWRFAKIGDPYFQGEIGEYYSKVMNEKRKNANHTQASKTIGWKE